MEAGKGNRGAAGPDPWWRAKSVRSDLERVLRELNDCRAGKAGSALERLAAALDALLDFPSHKLAIYGSLAPGEVNHYVVADLAGAWHEGFVRGHVSNVGWGADYGFPALTWNPEGPKVSVKVFESRELPDHWERIDRFEGDGYRRILIPVEDDGGLMAVASIYVESTT